MKGRRLSEKEREAIRSLKRQGKTNREIAKILNPISASTVSRVLNDPRTAGGEKPNHWQAPVRKIQSPIRKGRSQGHERLRPYISNDYVSESYSRDTPEIASIGSAGHSQPPKNSTLEPERVMHEVLQLLGPPQDHITKFMNIFCLDPHLFRSNPKSLRQMLYNGFGVPVGEAAFGVFNGFAHKFH